MAKFALRPSTVTTLKKVELGEDSAAERAVTCIVLNKVCFSFLQK